MESHYWGFLSEIDSLPCLFVDFAKRYRPPCLSPIMCYEGVEPYVHENFMSSETAVLPKGNFIIGCLRVHVHGTFARLLSSLGAIHLVVGTILKRDSYVAVHDH